MNAAATILHADLDAFYASVEQLLDPSLRGRPIAVGGGVVLAASYEAKAFGVRGGMPGRRARELCPQLTFVSGHFKEYQRLGDAAIEILGDYTPLVERISIDEAFADVSGCSHLFGPPADIAETIRRRVREELGLPISVGVARTKHLAKIASQVAKPDGLVVVDPESELDFLHDLPVELMWGVGPVTKARLAEKDVLTIGQLAKLPRGSLEPLVGDALGQKLAALAWNRDPREIKMPRRAQSAGAQSALGKKPAAASIYRPTLRHLADRVGSRLRAKSRLGRTVSVRVRFADLRAVTRSVTLPAPISATATLAEIAEELVRRVLADHPDEQTISLLAISVSNLEDHSAVQLEFPLGLADEGRRPGAKKVLRVGWSIALSTGSATASDGRRSATRRLHWELSARFPTRSASSPKRIYDRRRERRASWQQCEPFSWHRPMGLERRPVRARASRDHAHDRRAPEDRALSAPTRRRGLRPDDGQRCALSRRADERQLISIRPIAL
jgi:DNA polymerase-4